jgi:hypothetical protein
LRDPQRREVRRRGGGALNVVAIEGGEQKRWRHRDDGAAGAVEHALRQKREVRAHRQRDARMRRAGTDPAANQREVFAGVADDGRLDGGARGHHIAIDGQRGLGQGSQWRENQGECPEDHCRAQPPRDAPIAAAASACLSNKGGHVVAPEAAQSSESSEGSPV